jgi:Tfp pilus assembly protein PilX
MSARRKTSTESGMSIIVIMLILMFLLALGLAVVWYTSLQMGAARNLNSRQAALNAAQAGIQHARSILAATAMADWHKCLEGVSGNSNNDIPDQTHPTRKGAILYNNCVAPSGTDCNVAGPLAPVGSTPCSYQVTAGDAGLTTVGSYTVWIKNNQGQILAGSIYVTNDNGVVVHAEGKDAAGISTVVVEASLTPSSTQGVDWTKGAHQKGGNAWGGGATLGKVSW